MKSSPIQVDSDDERALLRLAVEGDPRRIGTAAEQLVAHVAQDLADRIRLRMRL